MTTDAADHRRTGASRVDPGDDATVESLDATPPSRDAAVNYTGVGTPRPAFTLLQSEWWARVRSKQGWTRLAARTERGDGASGGGDVSRAATPLVLLRRLGPLRFAYAPHAFASSVHDSLQSVRAALSRLVDEAGHREPHIVRWDVPWAVDAFDRDEARRLGLVPSARVQPPDTVVIDLSPDEDALLGTMKSKTRYNVRLAGRKGVEVTRAEGADALSSLSAWYELYRVTAQRDRIAIHPEQYYRDVVGTAVEMQEAGEAAPTFTMYTAHHEDDLLAGIVVASWDGMSTYLYGASANHKRNLMASYQLQWEAIRGARAAGDTAYDMFGIPPTDDPGHSMHGLYRFKTGFGGRVVHRPGCWDLSPAPLSAALFRAAERTRAWYHHRLRKRARRA